jgi:molybdenum cofactor biosynthesis protein B
MGAHDHKEKAAKEAVARCVILTVTDTKTRDSDTSGRKAVDLLRGAGHEVPLHALVRNDGPSIAVAAAQGFQEADLVVTIGGTGISKRDLTVDAIRPLLARELPGFGELFRSRSVPEIGTSTIMSRALLGITPEGKLACCLPGSESAVRLGLQDLLIPELKHLLWELRRYA